MKMVCKFFSGLHDQPTVLFLFHYVIQTGCLLWKAIHHIWWFNNNFFFQAALSSVAFFPRRRRPNSNRTNRKNQSSKWLVWLWKAATEAVTFSLLTCFNAWKNIRNTMYCNIIVTGGGALECLASPASHIHTPLTCHKKEKSYAGDGP